MTEKKVENIAEIAFKIFVAKLPVTVRLEAVVEASVDEPEFVILVEARVVMVAFVRVELIATKLSILEVEAFDVEALVVVAKIVVR